MICLICMPLALGHQAYTLALGPVARALGIHIRQIPMPMLQLLHVLYINLSHSQILASVSIRGI